MSVPQSAGLWVAVAVRCGGEGGRGWGGGGGETIEEELEGAAGWVVHHRQHAAELCGWSLLAKRTDRVVRTALALSETRDLAGPKHVPCDTRPHLVSGL